MERFYISDIELSGYKSINELSVRLNPGLNIIIGENGVGKTNFMIFLKNCIDFDTESISDFSANYTVENHIKKYHFFINKEFNLILGKDKQIDIDTIELKRLFLAELQIETEGQTVRRFSKNEKTAKEEIWKNTNDDELIIRNAFIRHGIPQEYLAVSEILNIEARNNNGSDILLNKIKSQKSNFIKKVLFNILIACHYESEEFNKIIQSENGIVELEKNIKETIEFRLRYIEILRELLKQYSPIQDFRISDKYMLQIDGESKRIAINNFYFEFFVDNKWLLFSDLSDGTKRLFHIISEVFEVYRYEDKLLESLFDKQNIMPIVFIEEPELGVHPNLLSNLMRFLKEQSRTKQIIITTHSPVVLDVLESDELDAIIIARKRDGKTILKPLTDEKKIKAKAYIEEVGSLSDYWLHSDLED